MGTMKKFLETHTHKAQQAKNWVSLDGCIAKNDLNFERNLSYEKNYLFTVLPKSFLSTTHGNRT